MTVLKVLKLIPRNRYESIFIRKQTSVRKLWSGDQKFQMKLYQKLACHKLEKSFFKLIQKAEVMKLKNDLCAYKVGRYACNFLEFLPLQKTLFDYRKDLAANVEAINLTRTSLSIIKTRMDGHPDSNDQVSRFG